MLKLSQVPIGQHFPSRIGNDQLANPITLGTLISNSLSAALIGAGVMLLFFIIIGGFRMISGAGNSNPQNAARGSQAATAAVAGFVVVFIAYWVIQLIEAVTGTNFVTAPNF